MKFIIAFHKTCTISYVKNYNKLKDAREQSYLYPQKYIKIIKQNEKLFKNIRDSKAESCVITGDKNAGIPRIEDFDIILLDIQGDSKIKRMTREDLLIDYCFGQWITEKEKWKRVMQKKLNAIKYSAITCKII